MNIGSTLAVLLLCAPTAAASQNFAIPPVRYPTVRASAKDAATFVPSGWVIASRDTGDLNRDGRADFALLIRMNDPANVRTVKDDGRSHRVDTNPYMLLVLLAEPRGGFRLAASNHRLFSRPASPFSPNEPVNDDTVRLDRGAVLVTLGYLRSWASYRFRWQRGDFRLIGYESGGVMAGCVGTYSINYLTRRVRKTAGPISSDRTSTAHRNVVGGQPPTLGVIDPDEFDAESTVGGEPLPCPAEVE